MMMNIQRQPKRVMSRVSNGAAIAVPSVDEQFQMPVAVPRPVGGNQSRTMRALAGDCGASPRPSRTRATANWAKPATRPPATWATDQSAKPAERMRRAPSRSSSAPAGNWARA